MHPIEHLRHVARARGAEPAQLAREAATALGTLRADHANLVVASRRIVGRHPEAGQLWWLCSRLLLADDPRVLAWELADRLGDDPVADLLAEALPERATVLALGDAPVLGDALVQRDDLRVWCVDGEFGPSDLLRRLDRFELDCEPIAAGRAARVAADAQVVLVPAVAACTERALAPRGSQGVAAAASSAGTPVWLVAGTGTRLPTAYVDEIARRTLAADRDDAGRCDSLDELSIEVIDRVVADDGVVPVSTAALRPDCPLAPELLRTGVT